MYNDDGLKLSDVENIHHDLTCTMSGMSDEEMDVLLDKVDED